jgi:hypothetical protein
MTLNQITVPLGKFYGDTADCQSPSDVAVIIPTLLRPQLRRAVTSIYEQDFKGRIQIAIGVDKAHGNIEELEPLFAERPDNISVLMMNLPFSTSVRHGGIHAARDGGATRTILGYAANAPLLAFLDDDNSYLPEHIATLSSIIKDRVWSSGQRILVDEETEEQLAVDVWDSAGPDKGQWASIGGFIDTNCIMVDKLRIGSALGLWAAGPGLHADKTFFKAVSKGSYRMLMRPTVLYRIRKTNYMWKFIHQTRANQG